MLARIFRSLDGFEDGLEDEAVGVAAIAPVEETEAETINSNAKATRDLAMIVFIKYLVRIVSIIPNRHLQVVGLWTIKCIRNVIK